MKKIEVLAFFILAIIGIVSIVMVIGGILTGNTYYLKCTNEIIQVYKIWGAILLFDILFIMIGMFTSGSGDNDFESFLL